MNIEMLIRKLSAKTGIPEEIFENIVEADVVEMEVTQKEDYPVEAGEGIKERLMNGKGKDKDKESFEKAMGKDTEREVSESVGEEKLTICEDTLREALLSIDVSPYDIGEVLTKIKELSGYEKDY